MIRNGFYGNTEDEFLQYCEAATCRPPAGPSPHDPLSPAHLLVGIEPAGLESVNQKYPIDEMVWSRDPRFGNLLQATHLLASSSTTSTTSTNGSDDNEGSVVDMIRAKVGRLLYVPVDEISADVAIHQYGIDSMVAAELRNWLFAKWGVD
ncbi:MAG: hypothetical protein LQ352_001922, partial [Teloschistes flavicans]